MSPSLPVDRLVVRVVMGDCPFRLMLLIIFLSCLSLGIWIYLLEFRGRFWRTDYCLEETFELSTPGSWPSVGVVIPARNEAELLPITVRSLLTQDYPGAISILVIDDHSTDDTAAIIQSIAQEIASGQTASLVSSPNQNRDDSAPGDGTLVSAPSALRTLDLLEAHPLPPDWTGKLWALEQGTQHVMNQSHCPDYILLTDADIEHDPGNLRRLVNRARSLNLDLASVMVRLRCQSVWERLLIPAFVFFFQKLYPFQWVNLPSHPTAAAAGGCILLRPQALQRIGGIQSIRDALIDDCTLALAIKWGPLANTFSPFPFLSSLPLLSSQASKAATVVPFSSPDAPPHPIWLGLSTSTRSLRPYASLKSIWNMVARTAYAQLQYSPLLLLGTLVGMTLVYLMPVFGLFATLAVGQWLGAIAPLMAWGIMAMAYRPTLKFYRCPLILSLCLPLIAFLYTLMTLDSAIRHWQGRGGAWKGRTYSSTS